MSLVVTPISRCLEKKLVLFGYEVPDLLFIFFVLSILNFLLGWTGNRVLLVWCPTIALAVVLRIGKRGKPDNFLLHGLKLRLTPKYRSAFSEPTHYRSPPRIEKLTGQTNSSKNRSIL